MTWKFERNNVRIEVVSKHTNAPLSLPANDQFTVHIHIKRSTNFETQHPSHSSPERSNKNNNPASLTTNTKPHNALIPERSAPLVYYTIASRHNLSRSSAQPRDGYCGARRGQGHTRPPAHLMLRLHISCVQQLLRARRFSKKVQIYADVCRPADPRQCSLQVGPACGDGSSLVRGDRLPCGGRRGRGCGRGGQRPPGPKVQLYGQECLMEVTTFEVGGSSGRHFFMSLIRLSLFFTSREDC